MQWATTSHNEPQRTTTTHNEPQRTRTNHKEPQRPTTSHNELQRATTNHNHPQRATTSHNNLQQPPQKLSSITLWTLYVLFIKKMIIRFFYGLLFLIFNALLFSFVKFKRYTYHNSYLPSDLTKIKTSSAAFNVNLLTFFS